MSDSHPAVETIQRLLQSPEPVKWLFTGDSITHGALHTMGHRDFPQHFSERVRWELRRTQDCVINNGCNGWTIKAAAANLANNVLQFKPDVVFLNFGPNDCREGAPGLADFKKIYGEVLDRIASETGALLVLQTPNGIVQIDVDWHATRMLRSLMPPNSPEFRLAELPAYAEAVREIASERELLLIDHDAHWAEAAGKGAMIYWLSDAIHPNEYGHRAMAHTLLRTLGLFDPESNVCRLMVP